jgi:hypothetical protein
MALDAGAEVHAPTLKWPRYASGGAAGCQCQGVEGRDGATQEMARRRTQQLTSIAIAIESLPREAYTHAGGHGRTARLSAPMHRWPKFGGPMRRARRVGLDASHRRSVRNRRAGPIGRVRTHADTMRRPAGDALRRRWSVTVWCYTFERPNHGQSFSDLRWLTLCMCPQNIKI